MLSWLVSTSVRFRGVVLALALLVLAYGIYVIFNTRHDVYPEFAPPQVTVQTEAPGLSPVQVEVLVTRPLENVLNGVSDLSAIRSQSIQGLSVVTTVFEDGTDIYRARQVVSERLTEALPQMPPGVQAPVLSPMTSATGLALVIGLTSDEVSSLDLRTFADWTLRPHLLAVPGVARVSIFGGEVKQIQAQIDPLRLAAVSVSLNDVIQAARNATGVRGAGFLDTAAQRVVVRSDGAAVTAAEVGSAVLGVFDGRSVRLKDVTTVAEAGAPRFGDAQINGKPGLLVLVSAQYGANTLEVTDRVEAALSEMDSAIRAANITLHPDLFRPADFIEHGLRNMGVSLLIGAGLVTAILFLSLYNLRTGLISITAIPLSLVSAIIVLHHFGASLNTLTLGGLVIAIGAVVDDAIIDVENIFRRLKLADPAERARHLSRIVFDASIEVRSAIVYATFIVALVFFPVLTMSGIQGSLFTPLAVAYILAILASLLVAVTVTPAMACLLLPTAVETARVPRYVSVITGAYERLLRVVMKRPATLIAGALLIVVLALATLPFLGEEFLPEFRESHFIVHMALLPGASLEESMRMGKLVAGELRKNPSVESVAQQVGRAEQFDDIWGPNYSEIHVALKPVEGEGVERLENEITAAVNQYPGASFAVKTFLADRMEEIISGSNAEVVIQVFGEDLDELDSVARNVLDVVAAIPGAVDPQIESPQGAPQLVVRLKPECLQQYGFQPVAVLEAVQAGFQGVKVGQIYEGQRVFDVSVILAPDQRRDPAAVGDFLLDNAEGSRVPLHELADIYETSSRYAIGHERGRRRQNVLCNVSGRDLASFVAEAKQAVSEDVALPRGVYVSFAGASEARAAAQSELLLSSFLATAGIVLLLVIVFRSLRNGLLVLVNLPFALVGGLFAAAISGGNLSVGSMVGFVTLFGITVRNSIMMMSHFEHVVTREGEAWSVETAIRGASERFLPVLMTALTTGLGLLPLALGSGEAGREIEGPMAIIILGGLTTSTVLNLLVLPALALHFTRFQTNGHAV